MNNQQPLVSIVIPCFNEEAIISECINSLVKQSIPKESLEIIVVDGNSTDNTCSIIKGLQKKNQNLILLNNPKRITPIALNIGIKNSTGKYVVIMGAHAIYDKNYINHCLKEIENGKEIGCVGGPINQLGDNNFGKAVAIGMSSLLGVGNPKHREPDYNGFAEMACFPMFKREVFSKVGYYDEKLIKNQDDEFCFRVRKSGYKILLASDIISSYYVRNNIQGLFKQYFSYGYWRVAVLKKHKLPIAFRQQVPFLFLLTISLLFIVGMVLKNIFIMLTIPILYLLTLIFFTLLKLNNTKFKIAMFLPLVIVTLHTSYGSGFIKGIIDFFILRKIEF